MSTIYSKPELPEYKEEYFDVELEVIWTDRDFETMLEIACPELLRRIRNGWEKTVCDDWGVQKQMDGIEQWINTKLKEVGLDGEDRFRVLEGDRNPW